MRRRVRRGGVYYTPKAAADVVSADMAKLSPDIVLANPPLTNFAAVSDGCKELAKRMAAKNPGGGGLWRLRR